MSELSNNLPPAKPPAPPSKVEAAKTTSNLLRGSLATEFGDADSPLSTDAENIIKHHGAYQQDHRDRRRSGLREYSFFVRTRLPGGQLTAGQLLTELELCDEVGDGTLRVTDRQGLQLHGVTKRDFKAVIRRIDAVKLTSYGACGDVVRNIMCCPAPVHRSPERDESRHLTGLLAQHFALRSKAYYDIWLKDDDGQELVGGQAADSEPVYGASYLPRKFKFGFALADDNCTDALTQDIGFVALPPGRGKQRFNVYAGGGMGVTPARADTFPAVGQLLGMVDSDGVLPLAHAAVQVFREYGNRADRKRARLKYLVAEWGIDRFRQVVCESLGKSIASPEALPIAGIETHHGWHPQGEGKWFLGLRIESGRIKDSDEQRLKTALRELARTESFNVRLTPLQDMLLCNIDESRRDEVEQLLVHHGIAANRPVEPAFSLAIACPALPMCGLAITESERVMPAFLKSLRDLRHELSLQDERISVRMTGCPNGCTRPYVAEIGIVGKAVGRYTLFLGGNVTGTRLAFKYRDQLTLDDIIEVLRGVMADFAIHRTPGEAFGDFCDRRERVSSSPSGRVP